MDLSNFSDDVILRASKVKLLLMDCDGVLTNGSLFYGEKGELLKVFCVKDGQGIAEWHKAGFKTGIITGRNSAALEQRVNELNINFLRQGSTDKITDYNQIVSELGLTDREVAYIGDDVPDLPLFGRAGLAVTVNDAHWSIKGAAHLVTKANGGYGAVRECIDMILMTKSSHSLDNARQI